MHLPDGWTNHDWIAFVDGKIKVTQPEAARARSQNGANETSSGVRASH